MRSNDHLDPSAGGHRDHGKRRKDIDQRRDLCRVIEQGKVKFEREGALARAQVGGELPAGDAKTPRTLSEWTAAGVTPDGNFDQDKAARLIDFTVEEGKEYWLAFNNFEVITRYNNSDFYAMSVFQLAEELKAARKAGKP